MLIPPKTAITPETGTATCANGTPCRAASSVMVFASRKCSNPEKINIAEYRTRPRTTMYFMCFPSIGREVNSPGHPLTPTLDLDGPFRVWRCEWAAGQHAATFASLDESRAALQLSC